MILNRKNNVVLPNGLEAFDLRKGDNQICAYGQKEKCIVETPVRFGGGYIIVTALGHLLFLMEIPILDMLIKLEDSV